VSRHLLIRCRAVVDRLGCSPAEALALVLLMLAAAVVLGLLWWWQRPVPAPGIALAPSPSPTIATPSAGPGAGGRSVGSTPTPAPVVHVHVTGAVDSPGVYALPSGSRVVDAIERAGGATSEADLERVNLAVLLSDGVQVRVPTPGEPLPAGGLVAGGAPADADNDAPPVPLDLNGADAAALEELPGIGPVTAQKIIDHRDRIGRFQRVEQLLDIRGIGEATLAELSGHVTVGR
jgi:competence protein ComEA